MGSIVMLKAWLLNEGLTDDLYRLYNHDHSITLRIGYWKMADESLHKKLIKCLDARFDSDEDFSDGFNRCSYIIDKKRLCKR